VDFGIEDRDTEARGRGDVGVGVREPLDEAVETEAAQVIGHLIGGVVRAEQAGDEAPQVTGARALPRRRPPRSKSRGLIPRCNVERLISDSTP
jgi:hypothetical protein